MKNHKSGQAALIIVIVTMVTALGIAVSSATQTSINLRETVYSTQSAQALACAESGAERALGEFTNDTAGATSLSSNDNGYAIEGCTYSTSIQSYPCTNVNIDACNGDVFIPNLDENAVQEIKVDSASGKEIDITFNNNGEQKASLAVYLYKSASVDRKIYHCGTDSPNSDFDTLGSGSECTASNISTQDVNVVRLRPLYTNMAITISGSGVTSTGHLIESIGTAGTVQRNIVVYRFNSKLPAVFDEAVVSFGSGTLE